MEGVCDAEGAQDRHYEIATVRTDRLAFEVSNPAIFRLRVQSLIDVGVVAQNDTQRRAGNERGNRGGAAHRKVGAVGKQRLDIQTAADVNEADLKTFSLKEAFLSRCF